MKKILFIILALLSLTFISCKKDNILETKTTDNISFEEYNLIDLYNLRLNNNISSLSGKYISVSGIITEVYVDQYDVYFCLQDDIYSIYCQTNQDASYYNLVKENNSITINGYVILLNDDIMLSANYDDCNIVKSNIEYVSNELIITNFNDLIYCNATKIKLLNLKVNSIGSSSYKNFKRIINVTFDNVDIKITLASVFILDNELDSFNIKENDIINVNTPSFLIHDTKDDSYILLIRNLSDISIN